MSPIKNIAASILAAARITDGQATTPPEDAHREPSIGMPPGLIDNAADESGSTILPDGDRLAYMADVIELQRAELTRLVQENQRLHERVDRLVKMQEREQVLRQQMHTTLERLSTNPQAPALPYPAEESAEAERKYVALKQTVAHLVTHIQRLNPEPNAK